MSAVGVVEGRVVSMNYLVSRSMSEFFSKSGPSLASFCLFLFFSNNLQNKKTVDLNGFRLAQTVYFYIVDPKMVYPKVTRLEHESHQKIRF